MRVTRIIFPRATAVFFFFWVILFFSLVYFAFFDPCFLLFVCCFFNLKRYILTHIWLRGWVSDKKTFTRPIFGNKTTFFWPDSCFQKKSLWLYVLIMSRTRFRVNPHSIVAWMSRNFLLEAGTKSEVFKWLQPDSNPQPLSSYTNTQPFNQSGYSF